MLGRGMSEGNVQGGNNRTSLLQERFLVVDECALVARQDMCVPENIAFCLLLILQNRPP